MQRLLTLDDLCKYYQNHKNTVVYSATKNDNTPVTVQLPGSLVFNESEYNAEEGLLRTHLKSCHIGDNRNQSTIEKDVMEECAPSIYNRPILGYIHQLKDGSYDFAGHEMFINDDGELEYEEIPVGCVPESGNAQLVYDEDNDKTYLEVDAVIYEQYTKAADILKEKGECKVSVELNLLDFSYNPKKNKLIINKFYFSGITILGVTRDGSEQTIQEGMQGSKITLKDFKVNNSVCNKYSQTDIENKLIEMQESIKNIEAKLSGFNIESFYGKEENNLVDNVNLNETFEETEVVEETSEVTEEMSTDTVEETPVIEESFEDETPENEESEETPDVDDEETDDVAVVEESEESEEEPEVVEVEEIETSEENTETFSETPTNMLRTYEISLEDTRSALYGLLSLQEEADQDYYWIISTYSDYFIYQSYRSGNYYKQLYSVNNDEISFEGNRVEVFCEFLTEEEKSELETMRSNYSSILNELNVFKAEELHADKMTVFNDTNYQQFLNTEEFKSLMSKENVDKYSKEELQDKAEITFAKLVKAQGTFAATVVEEKPEVKTSMFTAFSARTETNSFLDKLLNQK
jgi:hypothetical protein